jgi:hypothetical protein
MELPSPKAIANNIHDEDWRLRNIYSIRNKAGKTVPFRMNKTQEVLHASPIKYNMALKSRQQGVTTYYILKYFNRCIFKENYTGAIISHDRESLEKLFRIVKFAYEKLPNALKPRVDRGGGSKYEFYFPKLNSRIYVSLEVRSEAVTDLHVSEYGLMKDKQRFNASVDAVPSEGDHDISIESTPFGINHFYYDWFDPDFPFKKHFFPWFFHHENRMSVAGGADVNLKQLTPDELKLSSMCNKLTGKTLTAAQIKWRRVKMKMKGGKSFKEEQPEDDVTCFMTSGNSVVDLELFSAMAQNCPEPIRKTDSLRIYKKREPGTRYVIGVDVAEGVGSDSSVAVVLNKSNREQVAVIRSNKIKLKAFSELIFEVSKLYLTDSAEFPLLGIERNNHGHTVINWLAEKLHYNNLFKHDDERYGWKTNSVTRPVMIDDFIDAVEESEMKLNDFTSVNECMKLVDNNGKIEAMKGEHDDTVIANAIALQMCMTKTSFLERMFGE